MSSEVSIPRTAVALGITDPVESARAELKAALAAIEEKVNVPKRVVRATDKNVTRARRFVQRKPVEGIAAVVGVAAAAGLVVWGLVRMYTR